MGNETITTSRQNVKITYVIQTIAEKDVEQKKIDYLEHFVLQF